MKDFFLKVAAVVVAGAIMATASALWSINGRLATIEARLKIQTASSEVAK